MSEDQRFRPPPGDDEPTESLPASRSRRPPVHAPGYRIVRQLGQGGMGEVYEAEQLGPVRRRVAFKVIRSGMDSKRVVGRFESERQALAMMSHPNIARVFEAGETERGRPYFAMEYVKGVPITAYCDSNRISTRERLELFIIVCEAVQHAHQKGIIHRDIKPSNVLVEVQGDSPVPKIIDFGLAKAIEQKLTEKTVFTEFGQLIGTPDYASPEQAEISALDVDTRTDVYSLGVLLYELLVGVLPFDPEALRRGGYEGMRRMLREEPPPLPSARLHGRDPETAAQTAERRRADPATLVRQLRGDLDWIVMRALEKDRTRRYPSASELAADIRRHLQHQAVIAGPPSTWYRARKFVRRHRLGVAAAALMALALVLGMVGASLGLVRARQAEAVAAEEAETSRQALGFMVGLFEVADPSESRGNTITAREILDRGAERIERELVDQPLVRARLMQAMGRVYNSLGLYADAEPLLRKSLAVRRQALGEDHLEVASSLHWLSWLYHAQGRYEEAVAHSERALAIRTETLGAADPEVAWSLHALGVLRRDLADYEAARDHLERALEVRESGLGVDHVDTAENRYQLGRLLYLQGDYEGARALYERALPVMQAKLGPDSPRVAWCLNDMGIVSRELGDYATARESFERSLAVQEKVLGPDHPDVAAVLASLGSLFEIMGRYAEAEQRHERALAIRERTLGPAHPDVGRSVSAVGVVLQQSGDYPAARRMYERALAILEPALGTEHPSVAATLNRLGYVSRYLGDYEAARGFLERALSIIEQSAGRDHPDLIYPLNNLGFLLRDTGDYRGAQRLFDRVVDISEEAHGPDHALAGAARYFLATALLGSRDFERARPHLERAIEIHEQAFGPEHLWLGWPLWKLASLYLAQGDLAAAEPLFRRSLELLKQEEGEESPGHQYRLGCYWNLRDDRDKALHFLGRAVELGYSDPWIARDPDLTSLHGHPEFDELVARVRERVGQG